MLSFTVLTILAAAPLVLTIVTLLRAKSGWVAPLTGFLASTAVAMLIFGKTATDIVVTLGDSSQMIVEVLSIIAGGVLLSRVLDASGAQGTLAAWLSHSAGGMLATTLMMTNGVIPFIESVTGFGVSVLIGLPLLIQLGFSPLRAAMLTVLGLTISAWGSMAPGTLLGSRLAEVSLYDLGMATAQINWIAPLFSGLLIPFVALDPSTRQARLRQCLLGGTMGLTLSGFVLGANFVFGTAVAGALGALLNTMLLLGIIALRRRHRARKSGIPLTKNPVEHAGQAFAPYAILIGGLITAQFVFKPLASPAIWLTIASISAVFIQRSWLAAGGLDTSSKVWRFLWAAVKLWVSVAIPTGIYMALGSVFASGGLAEQLAAAFATLGAGYLVLSPFLSAIGGYITASTTGANAMFITTQAAGAQVLGVEKLGLLGTHNAAASLWCLASPVRVELAYQVAAERGPVSRKRITIISLGYVFVTTIVWAIYNVVFLR